MSKGSRRRLFKALANRKRTPDAWFAMPVSSVKVQKNQVVALLPVNTGEKRGRNA
jgi:hypothetical protein